MNNRHSIHLLELFLATLFISTSGVLGRYIDMPTSVIIWWRCAIGLFCLFLYARYRRIDLKTNNKKDVLTIVLGGLFLGAHWITYFHSLKLSNVAIGMLSLHTFPVMTALMEPFFVKKKFDILHIVLGFVILIGIYIIAPDFDLENAHIKGILFGLLSAFFYALRNLILKRQVVKYHGTMLMHHQLLVLTIVLVPVMFLMETSGIKTQYPYVLILALLTTATGHTLFVHSLKHFSASTASLISSAVPLYGVFFGFLFLGEVPELNVLFGGILIVATVVIEAIRAQKQM